MKKLIIGMIIMSFVLSAVPCAAFSEVLSVKDFIYTDADGSVITEIPSGGTVRSEFTVENTSEEGSESYAAVLLYYNGGKLIAMDTFESTLEAGNSDSVALSIETDEELSRPEIVTCVWDSMDNMEPVAPPAYFGTAENKLWSLSLNGSSFELTGGLFSYERNLMLGVDEVPGYITYIPRDLASVITLNKLNNIYALSVASFNGEDVNEYTVTANIKVPDAKCILAGSKKGNASTWFFKAPPGSGNSTDLTWRMTDATYTGSSERPYMRFELPTIPDGYTIGRVTLSFYMQAKADLNNVQIIKINEDWDSSKYETYVGGTEFPMPRKVADMKAASISVEPVTIAKDESWKKYEIELVPECLSECKDGKLSVGFLMDYKSSVISKICATSDDMLPVISFELAE